MYKLFLVIILLFILICIINKNFESFNNAENEDHFKNKVILITGSTRGIGLSLAKKLAKKIFKLINNVRDESKLEDSLNNLKKKNNFISGISTDISK